MIVVLYQANEELYMSLIAYKIILNKRDAGVAVSVVNFLKNIDGWEIGITRETGVVYHALKKY
ncbi:hypothetical protein [Bacillus sp. 3G2]|uniref:hypothetical protein n=1 Tax=Bacillus sp. 3G2 TaxID=3375707 RepID=UPI00378704DD